MAELNSLIRVRKHAIEQKQKMLAELYRHAEELKNRRDTLETQLAIESEKTKDMDTELLSFFEPYARNVRHSIEGIDNARDEMEIRIKSAQDDMRDAFAELKKIEIIDERRKAEAIAELNKKDSAALDEIAIDRFMRKGD